MMRGVASTLETHHKVQILDEALDAASVCGTTPTNISVTVDPGRGYFTSDSSTSAKTVTVAYGSAASASGGQTF